MKLSPKQYTLAATSLGSSLAFIDATAVIVALPVMQKALHLGLDGQQWVFLAYSLALASLYLVGGALGDRYGYRKVFTSGIVGFAAASALAGLAPNGGVLIAARVLQGISGAFVTTNSLAWLRSAYGDQAGKAVGLWTSLTSVSTIAAPLIGGALAQYLSWRLIFYINLPLALLVIYWAARGAEEEGPPKILRPLDPLGSLFIAIGLGFLTYFLVQGSKHGFSDIWWSLVIGLVGLVAFVTTELRISHPMLPFRLFKIRNFSIANLETLLIYGALYGILVYFALYLQFLGYSPVVSSLFMIPSSVILILLASFFGGYADRKGPRLLLTLGPCLIGVGALLLMQIEAKSDVWIWGILGLASFSFGLAMIVAPITAAALKSVPTDFAGLASGINNSMSRIGSLTTVAIVGAVIALVFANSSGNNTAVPLEVNQTSQNLHDASIKAFRSGIIIVAGLAFASAAVGGLGLQNGSGKPTKQKT